MKNVIEKFILLIIILSLVIVVKELTILTEPKIEPNFTIETISATCMTEKHDLDIKVRESSIVIITPVQTPNPCYSIVGDVKISGNNIEIDLSAFSNQDICIQCVGEVTGKIVIQNLTKENYYVIVKTPDKVVSKIVEIK